MNDLLLFVSYRCNLDSLHENCVSQLSRPIGRQGPEQFVHTLVNFQLEQQEYLKNLDQNPNLQTFYNYSTIAFGTSTSVFMDGDIQAQACV
jgi:hypothetical protein